MLSKRKRNKGYFIIMMFFIMIILSALAASYSAFIIRQLQFAKQLENDMILGQIAESGLRYARHSLNNNASFRKTLRPVSCSPGEFTVTVSPNDGVYVITITAVTGHAKKEITRYYQK